MLEDGENGGNPNSKEADFPKCNSMKNKKQFTEEDIQIAITSQQLGNEEYKKENYQQAVGYYTKAIKEGSGLTNHVLYSNRSMSYIKLKMYQEAVTDAGRCILLQPDWFKGYHRMGLAQAHLGQLKEAASHYAKAIELCKRCDNKANLSELRQCLARVQQEQARNLTFTCEQVQIKVLCPEDEELLIRVMRSFGASVCRAKQRLYLFGGFVDGQTIANMSCFDIETNTWQKLKENNQPAMEPFFSHTGNVIGNMIYICRTLVHGQRQRSCCLGVDVSTCTWSELREQGCPTKQRIHHSTTVVDGKLYLFGGMSQSCENYNDFDVFDPVTCKWLNPPPKMKGTIPPARHSHTMSRCGDLLYLIGGTSQPDTAEPISLSDIHCLDSKTWTWSKVNYTGQAPPGLVFHSAITVPDEDCGTKIVIVGRRTPRASANVYVFDSVLAHWSKFPFSGPTMALGPRVGSVAAVLGGRIWLFGGVSSPNVEKVAYTSVTVLDIHKILELERIHPIEDSCTDPDAETDLASLLEEEKARERQEKEQREGPWSPYVDLSLDAHEDNEGSGEGPTEDGDGKRGKKGKKKKKGRGKKK